MILSWEEKERIIHLLPGIYIKRLGERRPLGHEALRCALMSLADLVSASLEDSRIWIVDDRREL